MLQRPLWRSVAECPEGKTVGWLDGLNDCFEAVSEVERDCAGRECFEHDCVTAGHGAIDPMFHQHRSVAAALMFGLDGKKA